VLPIFELAAAHIERFAIDFAELHVGVADHEFAPGVAHGGAAVAAAARLVEHQWPVLLAKNADKVDGEIGGFDLFGWIRHDCGASEMTLLVSAKVRAFPPMPR
jgi:hypothetical protein